jgi:hypothetical protein
MKQLKAKLFLAIIALLGCSVISLSQQSSPGASVPKGWKQINANGLFTFYLPRGAWDTGFSGTEDFYKEYRIGRMRFMFVYEPTSRLSYDMRAQEFGKGFQEQVVEIAGRKAYLFHYVQREKRRRRYYADLYIGDLPNGEVKLWLQADSLVPADLEIAKKIFHTVEFPQP